LHLQPCFVEPRSDHPRCLADLVDIQKIDKLAIVKPASKADDAPTWLRNLRRSEASAWFERLRIDT